MSFFTRILVLFGALTLSACIGDTGQVNSRVSGWALEDVSVRFGPEIGRTANGLDFDSNFVWNGYSDGNRKRQVIGLFRQAFTELGQEAMVGSQPVKMSVQINYFHALTDFSRLWCCGEHRIYADLAVENVATGEVLASGDNVYLGRLALGGVPGLVAVAAGRDQDVRIREGIERRTRAWLAQF